MILDAEKEIILRIKEIEKERQRREKGDNLSLYNKICRDKHLGLTAYMTTSEKKYFESITILRGLITRSK